jgi:hypothetical protein
MELSGGKRRIELLRRLKASVRELVTRQAGAKLLMRKVAHCDTFDSVTVIQLKPLRPGALFALIWRNCAHDRKQARDKLVGRSSPRRMSDQGNGASNYLIAEVLVMRPSEFDGR